MDDLDQKVERDKLYTRCLQVNHLGIMVGILVVGTLAARFVRNS